MLGCPTVLTVLHTVIKERVRTKQTLQDGCAKKKKVFFFVKIAKPN